ncbi:MAG: hypothetical protein BWZ05_02052 [Bacteroidetes bacterium ADurb.BinA245]|nr:MAG: hypothetical protein BWZ05_02052 [Bacteroidetes bacterium ADurb.BinA245]
MSALNSLEAIDIFLLMPEPVVEITSVSNGNGRPSRVNVAALIFAVPEKLSMLLPLKLRSNLPSKFISSFVSPRFFNFSVCTFPFNL